MAQDTPPSSTPPPAAGPQTYRRTQLATLSALFLAALVLISRYEELGEWFSDHEEDVRIKDPADVGGVRGGAGDDAASDGGAARNKGWGIGDLLGGLGMRGGVKSPSKMLDDLAAARRELDDLLASDYGEYATDIFGRRGVFGDEGGAFRSPTNASDYRLKRRMKRRVVEANLGMTDGPNFVGTAKSKVGSFTWVTGGHSASAGHGNELNQSYTMAIHEAAGLAFGAVGVPFEAKHRAMGSTSSGPEIGLCMDAIFGLDVDALSWDYGMTDGKDLWKYHIWSERAASHPTFPLLFNMGGRQVALHPNFESRGQGTFALDPMVASNNIPDSENNPDLASLPRGIAFYRCGKTPENDDICKDHKFDTRCEIKGKTSWHPGWKYHLLMGRLVAVFLTEQLTDAVRELAERDAAGEGPPSVSKEYLAQLIAEEESDRRHYLSQEVPPQHDLGQLAQGIGMDDVAKVLRGNLFCHSMRQPSQARCDGLVDGVKASAQIPPGHCVGIPDHYNPDEIPEPSGGGGGNGNGNGTLQKPWMVAIDQGWRNDKRQCPPDVGNHDYRDGFIVRSEDGWMGDIYPNDATREVLSWSDQREGIVILCETLCYWGKCPPSRTPLSEVGPKESGGNASVVIDGQPVVGVRDLGGCHVMVGEGGNIKFGQGTEGGRKGQFEIKFLVNKPNSYIELSSIIVL